MKEYILNISEEERSHLQWLAQKLGVSMEEVLTQSIMQALEENRTGVYDANDEMSSDE